MLHLTCALGALFCCFVPILTSPQDLGRLSSMALHRRHEFQPVVLVLMFVPLPELLRPLPRLADGFERSGRVIRPVFLRP